jgi:mannose-1-phosphate guanylyltransferase/phosphomannomutase
MLRRSVPCSWGKKGQVMRNLLKYTEDLNRQLIDGVRVIEDDAWVLVTPDRKKATFHIHAEAKDQAKAESLLREYAQKVEEWQVEKELGITI